MVKHIKVPVLVLTATLLGFLFLSCDRGDKDLLNKLKVFETGKYQAEELPEERIKELEKAIEKYKGIVDQKVHASEQIGEYYKMIAVKYIDREMYGEALGNLQKALQYFPDNEVIYYLLGVCSAHMAKTAVTEPDKKDRLLSDAEKYYLRAISLDHYFVQALYGLSVLYVFEMDRTMDAQPYLERILEKEKKNTQAMFLLARVYVYGGMTEDAVKLYDRIIENGQSSLEKQRARDLKQKVLEGSYG